VLESAPAPSTFCEYGFASDSPNEDSFYSLNAPWADLKAMFEGYIVEPSRASRQNFYRSEYAVLAWKCRHCAECREELETLKFPFDPEAARNWKFNPKEWVAQASAETGPASAHVLAAQKAGRSGNRVQSIVEFEEAAKLVPEGDPAKDYIARCVAATQKEKVEKK